VPENIVGEKGRGVEEGVRDHGEVNGAGEVRQSHDSGCDDD